MSSLINHFKQTNPSQTTISSNQGDIAPSHYASSFSSSVVKVSSPLAQPPWNYKEKDSHWINRRWSTLSSAPILQRQRKKLTNSQLWLHRQKRKTFPPAKIVYDKPHLKEPESLPEITGFIYRPQPIPPISSSSSSSSSSSELYLSGSSQSIPKRISNMLRKKKGKQPYRKKPNLSIETNFAQNNQSPAPVTFEPPPTISSDSTIPTSTPIKFPTPPAHFSAHFIDIDGHVGRVEYNRYRESNWLMDLFQRPLPCPYDASFPLIQQLTQEEFERYDKQLSRETVLFLFGFLFFPFWWIGFGLFLYQGQGDRLQFAVYHELYSIRTIGFLNGAFSLFSLFLSVAIVILILV